MYYRIFDEQTNQYLPQVHNLDSKTEIKKEMSSILETELSSEDAAEITSLKWNQYVVRLKNYGFRVDDQPTPFSADEEAPPAWEEWVNDEDSDEEEDY